MYANFHCEEDKDPTEAAQMLRNVSSDEPAKVCVPERPHTVNARALPPSLQPHTLGNYRAKRDTDLILALRLNWNSVMKKEAPQLAMLPASLPNRLTYRPRSSTHQHKAVRRISDKSFNHSTKSSKPRHQAL